ncbi:MAG: DNA/RNA non-specific endonuclease, partial [Spirochaetales bacterium]|nr:DNA/RNA non-specific endonuclease [Spirochaetales bacterium]
GLIVITGPVLTDGPYKEIGENGVDIPKRYFKALLDYTEPDIKAIGFIMNNEASKENIFSFAVSIDTVEEIAGLDFFHLLENELENNIESQFNINQW